MRVQSNPATSSEGFSKKEPPPSGLMAKLSDLLTASKELHTMSSMPCRKLCMQKHPPTRADQTYLVCQAACAFFQAIQSGFDSKSS